MPDADYNVKSISTAPLKDPYEHDDFFEGDSIDVIFDEYFAISDIPPNMLNGSNFLVGWGDDDLSHDLEDALGGFIDINHPRKYSIQKLAISPLDHDKIYAGTFGAGCFVSNNGGDSWRQRNSGIFNDTKYQRNIRDIAFSRNDPEVAYLGTYGFYRTTNGGESWELRSLVGDYWRLSEEDSIASIDVGNVFIYVGTKGFGVYRSGSGGGTWTERNDSGTESKFISDLAVDPSNDNNVVIGIYRASERGELRKTTNGGLDWSDDFAPWDNAYATDIDYDPENPSIILCSAISNYMDNQGGIYKYVYPNWEHIWIREGELDYDVQAVSYSPPDPTIIYAGTNDGVFKSTNSGNDWYRIGMNGEMIYDIQVVRSPVLSTYIYVGTLENGVFFSDDEGLHWEAINVGLSHFLADSYMVDGNGYDEPGGPHESGPGAVLGLANGDALYAYYDSPWDTGLKSVRILRLHYVDEEARYQLANNFEVSSDGKIQRGDLFRASDDSYGILWVQNEETDASFRKYSSLDVLIPGFDFQANSITSLVHFGARMRGAFILTDPFMDYFLLTWHGEYSGTANIYGRMYSSSGSPMAGEFPLAGEGAQIPGEARISSHAIAMADNLRFLVVREDGIPTPSHIYASLWAIDEVPPVIGAVIDYNDLDAVKYDAGEPTMAHLWADVSEFGALANSGIENVQLVRKIDPYVGITSIDTLLMTAEFQGYAVDLPMIDAPGGDVFYAVLATDRVGNQRRRPEDLDDWLGPLQVRLSGDIDDDGCVDWDDHDLLIDYFCNEGVLDPVERFYANVDETFYGLDCNDVDALEGLIPSGHCEYSAKVPEEFVGLGAVGAGAGESYVEVPLFLMNPLTPVKALRYHVELDSTHFIVNDVLDGANRAGGIGDCPPECAYVISNPWEEDRLLVGDDTTFIDVGVDSIGLLSVNVDSTASSRSYYTYITDAAVFDTAGKSVNIDLLRGKFFIPAPPPVSMLVTPISDTSLYRGDTLSFHTTITNHSYSSGPTVTVFIYGTTQLPGGGTFLVIDTTYIQCPPIGGRRTDVTRLLVPEAAPLGHYVFTEYVSADGEPREFDSDSFGLEVIAESGIKGGGPQLSGEFPGEWKVVSGWFGKSGAIVVSTPHLPLPKQYSLKQNYPNPLNPSTMIVYEIPEKETKGVDVMISIYNLRGQRVRVFDEGSRMPGRHNVIWDGRDEKNIPLASGVYIYRIAAGDFVQARKMIIIR